MILVDTDILIDYFRKKRLEEIEGNAISVITLMEFLRGTRDEGRTKRLLEELFYVIFLDNEIIKEYARLYKELAWAGDKIDERDLIIASTAITKKLPLWTRNIKHFDRLRMFGLTLYEM